MNESTLAQLARWQNFYVIVGSASGALTGLQFVVITLIAQIKASGSMREIQAFGTPTVVHFCTALLIAALATAPWQSVMAFAICLGVCGVAGASYSVTIFRHAQKAEYNPDFEDWVWYAGLPLCAHLGVVGVGVLMSLGSNDVLFALAAATLLFLLIGVHNSWDTVTYIAVKHTGKDA